jgi:hypothetical protein
MTRGIPFATSFAPMAYAIIAAITEAIMRIALGDNSMGEVDLISCLWDSLSPNRNY